MSRHKELGSGIYREYAERVTRLGRETVLPGDAQAAVDAAAAKLFA